MIHYDRESWADYARGVEGDAESPAMRRHLDGGCRPCARKLAVQRTVVALAVADRRLAPPDLAVRRAKGFFALNRPERHSLLAPIELPLLGDSGLEPVQVGVRGADASERHVIHESDEFGLDLRISVRGPVSSGVLTGILAGRSGEPIGRVPAYLIVADRVVDQALSDGSGQFELAADFDRRAELWLEIGSDRHITVVVDPVH